MVIFLLGFGIANGCAIVIGFDDQIRGLRDVRYRKNLAAWNFHDLIDLVRHEHDEIGGVLGRIDFLAKWHNDLQTNFRLVQFQGRFINLGFDSGRLVGLIDDAFLMEGANGIPFKTKFISGLFQRRLVVAGNIKEADLEFILPVELTW